VQQGLKDFKIAITCYIHAALRGSNNASICKHATARYFGGHLGKLSDIARFPKAWNYLQDLIIV